jgi:hypothetical protein
MKKIQSVKLNDVQSIGYLIVKTFSHNKSKNCLKKHVRQKVGVKLLTIKLFINKFVLILSIEVSIRGWA